MCACRSQENRVRARKISKLAARSEHVTALTLANKDIKSASPQHVLKPLDNDVIRAAEFVAGKFIERNQIHFASDAVQELEQAFGILLGVIHASQQHVFERQPAVWRKRILAACG